MSNPPVEVLSDVVVIGSGAAGLMAALEAADAGCETIVLESEEAVGGSTGLSGAYVALCETSLQPGSRKEFLDDLIESHHGDCQEDLSRLYVEEAPATFERLTELGVHFVRTFQFAHMKRPWAHELSGKEMAGGAEIVDKLHKAAVARGIRFETSTRAARLIVERGRATGVVAKSPCGDTCFRAKKAVVIASGGFTRNTDLIKNFGRPGAEKIFPLTGKGSRGDGLLMGMGIGAGTSYMTAGIGPTSPSDPVTGNGVMVIYAGAIALNLNGDRFCRESDLYTDTCWAALAQPKATFVQIYDSAIRAGYAQTMMGKALTGFRELQAPTLAELMQKLRDDCGIDADRAAETVEDYNRAMQVGEADRFGRTHLVGTSGDRLAINAPPFYAAVCQPGTTHFNGGLSVDTDMAVRDLHGAAIPGLFAAGEVTGGFHGSGYMSGTFVGMALIFGRVAGRNAAAAA